MGNRNLTWGTAVWNASQNKVKSLRAVIRALKMHVKRHLLHGLEGKDRLGTALKSVASLAQSGGGKKITKPDRSRWLYGVLDMLDNGFGVLLLLFRCLRCTSHISHLHSSSTGGRAALAESKLLLFRPGEWSLQIAEKHRVWGTFHSRCQTSC